MHKPCGTIAPDAWRAILAAAILMAALTGGASQSRPSSAGWPGLWGPTRNGESPATESTAGVIKELWRRPTAGGYSEIAVSGNRAITMDLRDGIDYVIALDTASGRELWSARVGPTYRGHGGSHDGPIATPAIDGGDVFAVGPNGHLLALDESTGRERWRHDLVREFDASIPGWGFGSSPLVERTLVILPTGGEKSRGLLAFDRSTGRLVWSAPHMKSTVYSSAVAGVIAGTRQIVTAAGDRVSAVLPADGKLVWSVAGPGNDTEVANSPLVLPDDRVLLTYWAEAVMLKVTAQNGVLTATQLWRSPSLRGANGPTIHRDGFLYGFAGPQLTCVQADTGQVRWRERTGEGTLVGAGPNLLFLGQTSGDLRFVRASSDGFREIHRARAFTPDVVSVTGPSIADGRIFIRNIREMAAFAVADGR